MSGNDPRRRRSLLSEQLDRALELPIEERFGFLRELRTEDGELASELETLLAAEGQIERARTAGRMDEPGWIGRRLGPYEIVELLGRGGMGEVYRGLDTRLGRTVAIKLLAPGSLPEQARARFEREARAVAALDHANVCTLYDVGSGDSGELYLVMAHYAGTTLEQRLAGGPLPLDEALDIAAAIADGLAHAHRACIAHRDVKPANVMLTAEGGVKVLDFGIAKLDREHDLTHTGQSIGTPAYMAPEQLLGEETGPAADVWALGVVLYEMLAGRRPFGGRRPDPRAVLEAEPAALDLPPPVAALIDRALAKRPEERFASAGELASALRDARAELGQSTAARRRVLPTGLAKWPGGTKTLGFAVAVCVALAAAGAWYVRSPGPEATSSAPLDAQPGAQPGQQPGPSREPATARRENVPRLAVLPFENRTGDGAVDAFAAGVTVLLRDALSSSRHVRVLGPAAGGTASASVAGEILPAGEALVLAARVIDTASGEQLGGLRIDAEQPAELYGRIDTLARRVRRALRLPTDEAVDVFAADFAAAHPAAYERYLRGLEALKAYGYEEAQRAFEDALEIAPGFTMARFRLAQVLASTGRTASARGHLERAVAESPALGEREAGYVRATAALIERRHEQAAAGFSQLLDSFPYEIDAHHLLALALRSADRPEDALVALEGLARVEPEAAVGWSLRGEILLSLGRPREALAALENYLRLEPDSANGHHLVGDSYRVQGVQDLAADSYRRALEIDPDFHYSTIQLALIDAQAGRDRAALETLEALAANAGARPRQRLDAVFYAVALRRAQGRCRRVFELLDGAEALLLEEAIREPLALTVRSLCHLDLGEIWPARAAAERAAVDPPGKPYRYLFVRGLAELEARDDAAFAATVAELLAFEDEPTAERAATYLSGLGRLRAGQAEEAVALLREAAAMDGYAYAVYGAALAEALFETGRRREAEAAARRAAGLDASGSSSASDPGSPRLDLRLGRLEARLWLARIDAEAGRPGAADVVAELLEAWRDADPGFAPAESARSLAAAIRAADP